MSRRRGLLAGLAVAGAGALLVTLLAAEPPPAEPGPALTNEDIVRLVASGTAEREIIETIQARPEAFDLADDMVDELKLAGVPAAVVAAMRARHATTAPPVLPPERTARGHAHVTVKLNPGGVGPRSLRAPAWADEDVKARLKLPKENDQREVKDLAVFFGCTTGEHVPDLWRSKTPLGRDMVGTVRHEMLAFVAGDTPAGKKPQLTLPDRLEADVDESEPHDLIVGVAARIGDRWVQVAMGRLEKVTVTAGANALTARISRAGGDLAFNIELTAPKSAGR